MLTLWLMPDKETYLKIGQLIAELSSVHNTPSFEPHVTLISGITDDLETALKKTKKLAKENAATRMIDYPTVEGVFVERSMRFLEKQDNKNGIHHLDDISMASIAFAQETKNVQPK